MNKAGNLRFDSGFPLLPLGLPRDGWSTKSVSETPGLYLVTENGRLLFTPNESGLTFYSADAFGVLSLTAQLLDGLCFHNLTVRINNGSIIDVTSASARDGYFWAPTWQLASNHLHSNQADDVEEMITIIRAANSSAHQEFSSETIRIMVGLALCRMDLLANHKPAAAWRKLSPAQVTAITTWWR